MRGHVGRPHPALTRGVGEALTTPSRMLVEAPLLMPWDRGT